MAKTQRLSDFDHPEIQRIAHSRTAGQPSPFKKVESLFYFVRDGIPFGFPPMWDVVTASETLDYKVGYCTTKATLFHALCQAAGIPSRIHAGFIKLEIMRGILPDFAFSMLPEAGPHVWMEVELDGQWKPIDTYITDNDFYQQALTRLKETGWENGFGISEAKGPSSCAFNFGETGFVQMGAVVEDQGTWEDLSEYLASGFYTRMSPIQTAGYRLILRRAANKNIQRIREH